MDINEIGVRVAQHDAILEGFAKDLRDVALAVKQVMQSNEAAYKDLRETLDKSVGGMRVSADERNAQDRNRTVSILSIIIPVVLGISGVLWMAIQANGNRIEELQRARTDEARSEGYMRGRLEALTERVQELNQGTPHG